MRVFFEDLAVIFIVLHFSGVETNRCPFAIQVVGGPLLSIWTEERVDKEIFSAVVGGDVPAKAKGGRAVPWEGKTFDCTKGFPGEDVLPI